MNRNLRILVVDGSRVSRKVIAKTLSTHISADSVDITAVASACDALEIIAREKFDLITSSLLLPDMHGLDLCKTIRASAAHRFTPFIVVTAETHESLIKDGFSAGVTDYYDKTRGFKNFVRFIQSVAEHYTGLAGKVLYLEDNPMEAKAMSANMEHYGLEVVHVDSAERALGIIDTSYDLVVADFFLSHDMSGGDFLHNIRCGLRLPREEMPVLIVTGDEHSSVQAEIFRAGGNDFVTKPVAPEVLISRIRSLLLMKRQFIELKRISADMRAQATEDSLTGLYNKRYLVEHAGTFFSDISNFPAWVIVLDLDHFKSINDRHGHGTGDRVLEAVGRLLKAFFRKDDLVARTGGEEFVVLVRKCTRADCAKQVGELRQLIEKLRPAGLPITASIGVATNHDCNSIGFEELVAAADEAMYKAKHAGRNRAYFADGTRIDVEVR
ncbi:MAG: GGDEF domain-containing response regulator [Acidiferrobacterales bacterium]